MTDITPTQRRVLDIIKASQPIARRDIAEQIGMKKSTLSNHLDALRLAKAAAPSGVGSLATWSAVAPAARLPAVSDIFSLGSSMALASESTKEGG